MPPFFEISLNKPYQFFIAIVAIAEKDAHGFERFWFVRGNLTMLETDPELADLGKFRLALGAFCDVVSRIF